MSSALFPRGDLGGSAADTTLDPHLTSSPSPPPAGAGRAKPRSVVGSGGSFYSSARPTIPINPAWISPPCALSPARPAFPAAGLLTLGRWAPRLRSSGVVAGGVEVSRLRPWFIAMSLLVAPPVWSAQIWCSTWIRWDVAVLQLWFHEPTGLGKALSSEVLP